MKIRSGFVSNSSSSSYIIGVGKLINEEAFIEYCKTKHIDYEIMTTKDILEYKNSWSAVKRVRGDKTFFVNGSFDGNEVSIEINPSADEKFVSVSHHEEMEENEDGETNYDIDSDYFNDDGQAVFDLANQDFIEDWHDTYGAGRNG